MKSVKSALFCNERPLARYGKAYFLIINILNRIHVRDQSEINLNTVDI